MIGVVASAWAHPGHSDSLRRPPVPGQAVVYGPTDTVPAVGPDGSLIRCADGALLQVDPDAVPPPDLNRATETPAGAEITEGVVPRCGPGGGGAHGKAI